MEPCQSGLTYLFAKEAGCKSPRWFESSRLRLMYQKVIIVIILVSAIGIGIYLFNKKPTTITNFPSQGQTIVTFGDSLVAGNGATEGNDFSSLLEKLIGEEIINMGIAGNTTAQGLARVTDVNEKDPKVVMVLLGGNDFLRKTPIEETFKNLDTIVAEIQKEGAVVILLGVQGGVFSDPYKNHFEDLAKNRGALYVPNVLDGLIANQEYMSDAIHPNDAGYKKIAEKIYPILKKALGK